MLVHIYKAEWDEGCGGWLRGRAPGGAAGRGVREERCGEGREWWCWWMSGVVCVCVCARAKRRGCAGPL